MASGRWRMLALAWLAYWYFGVVALSLAPLLSEVERDLRLSNTSGGLLLGAYPLAYVGAALAVGRVCDVVGVYRATTAGLSIILVSALLRVPANGFAPMLAATMLLGIGGPVISTVLPKLVAEWFVGTNRTIATGVLLTGPSLGGAMVLGLSNSLTSVVGSWRGLYVVYGLVGVVVLVLWICLCVRDMPPSTSNARLTADALDTARRPRPLWKRGQIWAVVLVGVAGFTLAQGFTAWLPTILREQGFSAAGAGIWVSVSVLLTAAGSLAVPYVTTLSRRPNVRKEVVIGLLVLSAASILLVDVQNQPLTVAAVLLRGVLAGGMLPLLLGILLDLPSLLPAERATAVGLYFTVGQVAGGGSPVLVGWLRDLTGGFGLSVVGIAAIVLMALLPASWLTDSPDAASGMAVDMSTVPIAPDALASTGQ